MTASAAHDVVLHLGESGLRGVDVDGQGMALPAGERAVVAYTDGSHATVTFTIFAASVRTEFSPSPGALESSRDARRQPDGTR